MLRVTKIVDNVYPTELMLWKMNLIKEGFSAEDVMQKAVELGTYGHSLVEGKKMPKKTDQANIIKMGMNLKKFLEEYDPQYIKTEEEVFYRGPEGPYIGHIDIIANIKEQKWLIDTKTYGLYKRFDERETFKPIPSAKKAKVNLQTWLYSIAENGKYKDYKRGVLHINQYGYELVELKREPSAEIKQMAFSIIKHYKEAHTF